MSTSPDNEFDLEKLFLPAWAQQEPSSVKYAKYEGEERPGRRDDRRGFRPPRRDTPSTGRREGQRRPGGPRAPRDGAGGRPEAGSRGRAERPGGPRGQRRERPEPPPPLPEINLALIPDEKGVESLARQIKMTGRAYPLFEIAQMILQKPERHAYTFSIKKNTEGKPVQPLFVCALDDSLWLSEDEAVAHVLRKHFTTFYQPERTATEPPKGKYTFVAQCGISGAILGPPNYHDYQNQLRKLHAERFSRMPFEVYKSRVKIVRDEEVVKKWVEDQSWRTEYVCLNMPEPQKLPNMEAVEKHFRENHKDNIIKPVETHTLGGVAARALRSPELTRLVRSGWEDQRRFPLQIATVLSQQFAAHGLQFFKVNKTITHVSVARPHFLDLALTPVSDGVRRIVDYINSHPKCTRRQLVEALAPSPPPPTILPVAPEASAPASPVPVPLASAAAEPTADQTAIVSDLHWLVHQGHVIEFANGTLETAKKPVPKPPRPEPKPDKPAQAGSETEAVASEVPVETPSAEIPASEPPAESAPAVDPVPAVPEISSSTGAPAEDPSAANPEPKPADAASRPAELPAPEPPADPVESPS